MIPSSPIRTVSPGSPMIRLMNGVPVLVLPALGRMEHDDVAALVRVEPRGELVDQHVLVRLERPLHRRLAHLERLRDERLDDEERHEGQRQGLDDLDQPARGASHPASMPVMLASRG